ncbi:LysM peptidoglycan-binding domain-containing protein [Moraxella oblonga]|uniref:LysM peptidoglycan-binding domain-containing protein n=1 Tax=Moraxella oblonga TaxID=200413 RepID=UPI00082D1160|nr:LysM peptidoglycan-binding domain-containing protein [Moraxella oblonga]
MVSKQLLLGIGLVLGGGALVGILNSGDKTPKQTEVDDVAHPKVELRQDIQTEKHLSEQKKKERENNTLAQEQQAKEFVEEQERAKQQLSLASRTDTPSAVATTPTTNTANTINASVNSVVSEVSAMLPNTQTTTNATDTTDTLVVQTRPEAIIATKKAEENKRKQQARAKQQQARANRKDAYTIEHGDSLSKLSQRYNVPISAILSANNMSSADLLIAGDKIIIPNKNTAKKPPKTGDAVAKADKKSKKPETTTAQAKKSNNAKNVKPFYSVQVSLADSEAKANELVKQYRAAGYKVQTSKTSRGVRVLVGSTNSAEEAKKLQSKLNKDSRVNAGDAWVKRVDTINP